MSHYTFKVCNQSEDQEEIVDFLFDIRAELHLPDRQVCREIAALCFARGGVIIGYDGPQVVAMLGYFYGEPQGDCLNKEMAFMYVAGIRKTYRLTRVFYQGLVFSLRQLQMAGVKVIKMQAEAANPYTNKLYGRFAQPLGQGTSLRGKDVITYGARIEDALAKLPRKPTSPDARFNPTPHHQIPVVLR